MSFTDGNLYYMEKGSNRVVVMDKKEKERVLLECHNHLGTGGHQGRSRTYDKIVQSYYWVGIMEDVKQWVRSMDSVLYYVSLIWNVTNTKLYVRLTIVQSVNVMTLLKQWLQSCTLSRSPIPGPS